MYSTGFGKTYATIMAIKGFLSKNFNKNIVVIVPSDYLKIQWMQELFKNNLLEKVSVEIINSAIKKTEKVDLIILDECHRYASDQFFQIFKQRSPKLILGLSATFDRLDGKHQMLEQYCPVCDTITIKEAIENKWLSPYKEYEVLIEADDIDYYKELSEQFNSSFSVFNFNFNLAMRCVTNIRARRIYANEIKINHKDMDAITFTWGRALRERKSYIMNHPKKIEITKKILDYRQNSKAITFSATIKNAEKIGVGYIVHSGKTKKKNSLTIQEFSKLKKGCINTARSLDEGADIPGLNLAIVLCNSSSSTQKTQRVDKLAHIPEYRSQQKY